MDYKEYARQLRENAVKDADGVIRCSPELWEQIASIIENIDKPNTKPTRNQHGNPELKEDEIIKALECCREWKCKECPYYIKETDGCKEIDEQDILDLINRQKSEIERLKEGVSIGEVK